MSGGAPALFVAFAARFSWRDLPTFFTFLLDFWDLSAMTAPRVQASPQVHAEVRNFNLAFGFPTQ